MKQLSIVLITGLLLAGCARQTVEPMEDTVTQTRDLTDSDKDGVIAARDQCGDSVEQAKVNNEGCPSQRIEQESFELNVQFATASAQVREDQYADIRRLADFMRRYPQATVTIEGHASKVGNAEYNMALSQRRAEAIANVLVTQFYIDKNRVDAKGFGETQPLIDDESDRANEQNRRVIASVSGEHGVTEKRWTIYSSEEQ
ncbi:OmpA family protein [Salinivibrio sp. VYel1]|uniref:OmpA family protein n=1 Tax=Salinivibrio sp. VYel1 TaxID=2490490 RepID=UPI00128E6C46|nr:OmpA family protein [Salinivibrio sp. VYel1]MPX91235.1 OmpA family protein [Salinivibrio sp. VYel1]